MSTFSTVLLVLVIVLLGVAGYYYLDTVQPLQVAFEESQQRNLELTYQVEQLEHRLAEKVRKTQKEKESEIANVKSTYEELVLNLREQVDRGEVTITKMADQLKVNIVDRIIFPTGSADLSEAGVKVLQRVGSVLRNTENKRIRVEGHTDNVPIHRNLQEKFESNWELSAARATNVVRFLQDGVKINPRRLEAAGLGQYQPISSNKTRAGKRRNRRIEILLLPTQHPNRASGQSAARK